MRGAFPVSIGRACPAVPACHATCTTVLAGPKQAPVRKRICEIAKTWMRYRDRRIHVLLRRDGWRANIKRVRRLVGRVHTCPARGPLQLSLLFLFRNSSLVV